MMLVAAVVAFKDAVTALARLGAARGERRDALYRVFPLTHPCTRSVRLLAEDGPHSEPRSGVLLLQVEGLVADLADVLPVLSVHELGILHELLDIDWSRRG